MSNALKTAYTSYHDRIASKRHASPYWLRRYAHRSIHEQFLPHVQVGERVLDAGSGEGQLSGLLAQHGADVVGVEISGPNLETANTLAREAGLNVAYVQGDLENLPFPDESFDVVVSSHVLEHLPDLDRGLREMYRVTRDRALIAMPTCLNPACWVLLGGDSYWKLGRRSPVALGVGLMRTVGAFLKGQEGPDEGYGPNKEFPHIWRFPHVMRRQIERVGFEITGFEAGPLLIPYVAHYLPIARRTHEVLDRLRAAPILRNLGYGSFAVCKKSR